MIGESGRADGKMVFRQLDLAISLAVCVWMGGTCSLMIVPQDFVLNHEETKNGRARPLAGKIFRLM